MADVAVAVVFQTEDVLDALLIVRLRYERQRKK